MSTLDLISAIEAGDAAQIQTTFEHEISSRIADRLDVMRQQVAKNMFNQHNESVEMDEAVKSIHPDALHVKPAGGGKYKVHAVGKNFAGHVKTGEHLSDTELDDFSEMGGKVKHVKEDLDQIDE